MNEGYDTVETYESIDSMNSKPNIETLRDSLSKYKRNSETSQRKNRNAGYNRRDEQVSQLNKEVDDLIRDRKLEVDEAVEISRDISNSKNRPHFLDDTYHRLWAIRRRPIK